MHQGRALNTQMATMASRSLLQTQEGKIVKISKLASDEAGALGPVVDSVLNHWSSDHQVIIFCQSDSYRCCSATRYDN